MYELRILNGLHRGATLPMDGLSQVIGASEDTDIVLVDPGIETRHASLQLTENGWLLSALDGVVLNADTNQPQTELELQPGEFARVGQVWVTVVEQDAPWQNPPPEPQDVPAEAEAEAEESVNPDLMGAESVDADATAMETDGPLDEPGMMAAAEAGTENAEAETAAADTASATTAEDVPEEKTKRRWSRAIYAPLAVVTVLSACAAYAMTSKNEGHDGKGRPDIQADVRSKSRLSDGPGLRGPEPLSDGSNPAKALEPARLTPAQLRTAFRKRLEEVDLLRRFDLDLKDNEWNMKAALDDEESARFGRVLAEFVKQHHITFPVDAKVGSSENMLPFKIRQVISGSDASVVTSEGDRIYVGDTYRGMRLVAINGNHLSFSGKRKVEVKW